MQVEKLDWIQQAEADRRKSIADSKKLAETKVVLLSEVCSLDRQLLRRMARCRSDRGEVYGATCDDARNVGTINRVIGSDIAGSGDNAPVATERTADMWEIAAAGQGMSDAEIDDQLAGCTKFLL
jgi:hypothetical protein